MWIPAITLLCLVATCLSTPPGGSTDRETDWREEAEALRLGADVDGAIAVVERHLASHPDDSEGWSFLARTLEELADQPGRSRLILHDAAAAWDRVAELDAENAQAHHGGARDRLLLGEFDAAEAGAREALRIASSRGAPASPHAALVLRARMGRCLRVDASDRTAFSKAWSDVQAAIEELAAVPGEDQALTVVEAEWYASVGAADRAFTVLFKALSDHPASIDLHRALVELHVRLGVEERLPELYAGLAEAQPDLATVRWYTGYVERLAGDLAARERRNEDAMELYQRCVASMRLTLELDGSLAESALWVEMQARTALGWSALDARDVKTAEREWLAILEEDPGFVDREDGLGRTTGQGLGRLGGRYHVRDEIVEAERVSRRLAEVSEEAWKWNNVAYLLREIASDTERLGGGDSSAADMARSTFLESWKTYQKAAALAPHEPRIVNDTALVMVYHLRDDLDGAEQMLNEAIRLGEAQLAELGPDADEAARFPIAMAVGDAYQNLGFLYYRLRNDPARAREFFVKSVETHSGVRRGVVASIRAIDAGSELVEINPRTGGPTGAPPTGGASQGATPKPKAKQEQIKPMLSSPPQEIPGDQGNRVDDARPADVDWERSIVVAHEEAERTARRVLVYHRVGGGLGPSVEYLQRYLHSSGFEEAARGAITLLADRLRHTFTDRRRDGRLVMCPRARGVSCGEHMACAEEFETLWRESDLGVLSRDSNGLYQVNAEGLQRISRVEDTFERFSDPGTEPDAPRAAGGEKRPSAPWRTASAEVLSASRVLAARRELERRLFEPTSAEQRAAAVRALGARGGADNDELLDALARQPVDVELARLALEVWPSRLGEWTPLLVLQIGTAPAVREAAATALAGVSGVERELLARYLMVHPGAGDVELEELGRERMALGGLEAFR